MVSGYKFKNTLWYTGILAGILIAVFAMVYTLLGFVLRQEIDANLLEKIYRINRILRETKEPPECNQRFLDYIVSRGRFDFFDIREYTDVVDDKYILFVYCRDSLQYISRKYRNLELQISRFEIGDMETPTILLSGIPFSMAAIYKTGYSVYVGYELSIIQSVQRETFYIFLLVFPVGILLSIVCGYFITQRSLRVIKQINQTAARITSRNLSERIPVPKGRDEISQLIRTLNSMIDRLEKSFTMVHQFSHDAAHEIRTPLTIVRGEIEELLTEDKCPSEVSPTLESILEEIQYLSSIANKLLMLHNFDTGKIEYHFTHLDLSRIVAETFEDAQVLSSQKRLTIDLEKNESVQIKGNEELLVRLLWNIIDNAVKYTPEGGNIRIALEANQENAIIKVKDTGVGVSQEEVDKIFDRFYRVDKSRSRSIGGSGLGLAICKWIVDLHKGNISVQSEIEKGSEFIVILPLTDPLS